MPEFVDVLKKTGSEFSEDDCMSSGAAIAYYTIFSLPPLLAIIFMIATQFTSREKVSEVIKNQVGLPTALQQGQSGGQPAPSEQNQAQKGQQEGSGLDPMADRASGAGGEALWAKALGLVVLAFSATGVLAQLQFALNKAWSVEPDPEHGGFKKFVMKRVLSLGMIVVFGLLLLVSLVLTTLVDEFTAWVSNDISATVQTVSVIVNSLLTWGIASVLFAATFKILPDADIAWKDVWIGGAATGLMFMIGKELIGRYLQYSQTGSDWGSAAASMVGVLVWVYYSSLIVLLGAEFTQVWARRHGRTIQPSEGAVRIVEEKRYVRNAPGHPA